MGLNKEQPQASQVSKMMPLAAIVWLLAWLGICVSLLIYPDPLLDSFKAVKVISNSWLLDALLYPLLVGGIGSIMAVPINWINSVVFKKGSSSAIQSYFSKPFRGMIVGVLAGLLCYTALWISGFTLHEVATSNSNEGIYLISATVLLLSFHAGLREDVILATVGRLISRLRDGT